MEQPFPLVGRQEELTRIQHHLDQAAAGDGQLLVISGEAGIGKSALARRVLATCGWPSAVGYCPGPGETPSLGPWIEVVQRLQAGGGPDGRPLPAPLGAGATSPSTYEMAAALSEWLRAHGRPLLLLLEDLHWADEASLALLRHLALRLRGLPVLLLATYRTDEVDRSHPLWVRLPQLQQAGAYALPLRSLEAAHVAELVATALPPGAESAEVAGRLYRRAGGHPLFTCELLAAVSRPEAEGTLPGSIQQAIDQKLLRLAPGVQNSLAVAALIGESFPSRLLARVLDLPAEELAAVLEQGLALNLIQPEGPYGERFAFSHGLIREALLGRLIGPRRWGYHQRIGLALLAQPQPDPEAFAFHFSRANDIRAVQYLEQAGVRAHGLGALSEAAAHYGRALELLPDDDPRRAGLLFRLGAAVGATAMAFPAMDRSRPYWQEALKAAEASGNRVVGAWSRHYLALWQLSTGDPQCLTALAEVHAEQEAILADPALKAQVLPNHGCAPIIGYRAWALALAGLLAEARSLLASIRALPETAFPRGGRLNIEAVPAYFSGQVDDALNMLRLAADWRETNRHYLFALAYDINRLVLASFHAADRPDELDRLAERVGRLEGLAHAHGGYGLLDEGYSLLGCHQFMRGDWAAADSNLLGYMARRPEGPRWYWFHWFAAQLCLAQGDLSGAQAAFGPVLPDRPEDEPRLDLLQVAGHCLRARICLQAGQAAQARAWLEAADRALASRTLLPYRAGVRLGWAEWHRAAGDQAAALHQASQALDQAEAVRHLLHTLQARRLVGELAAAQGRGSEAEAHFRQALAIAERCRWPYELALTQLSRAQALPAAPGALEGLREARATFAQLGAAPALVAAEAALGAAEPPLAVTRTALPDGLSAREAEVIRLIAAGLQNKEVAARLHISPRTVDGHLRNIFEKTAVRGRAALVAYAARLGMMD